MTTMLISPLPKFQFFNNNGVPAAGGKLFSYAAGAGTNKQATYTDSTGGTPNANPIILDANGRCDCWLDPALIYKFVLAPSTDTDPPSNPFWTVDQVEGSLVSLGLSASSGSSLIGFIQAGTGAMLRTAQAKMRDSFNVKDFGALGDGATDDQAAIAACIAAAQAAGKAVFVPAGNYHHSSTFTLNGVVMYGEGYSSIFTATDGVNSTVQITGTGAEVRDMKLVGTAISPHTGNPASSGIYVNVADKFVIDGVWCLTFRDPGIENHGGTNGIIHGNTTIMSWRRRTMRSPSSARFRTRTSAKTSSSKAMSSMG